MGKEPSVIAKRFVPLSPHFLMPEPPMLKTHCQQGYAFYSKDHHRNENRLNLPQACEKTACVFAPAPSELVSITHLVVRAVEVWNVSEGDCDHK